MTYEQDPFNRDIGVGKGWPDYSLPKETLEGLVEASKTIPLREAVAQTVYSEGQQLLKDFRPDPIFQGIISDNPDFIRRRYYRYIGEGMLYACALFKDGLAVADYLLDQAQEQARALFKDNFDSGVALSVRADIIRGYAPGNLREVCRSLAIDPTGFDLLYRNHRNDQDLLFLYPTEATVARIGGMGRGVARYKRLYTESAKIGAYCDKYTNSPIIRQFLKLRRGFDDKVLGAILAP